MKSYELAKGQCFKYCQWHKTVINCY